VKLVLGVWHKFVRGRSGLAAAVLLAAQSAFALDLPSGLNVKVQEVLVDEITGAQWLRFRFLAPELANYAPGDLQGDFAQLCNILAAPYAAKHGLSPHMVVISFADAKVPFGETMPEVTQYFELFRLDGDACIWEGF
jgi:hypothetical protein